jgi:2-polyprenyl-6-methoxyphenol hydroxylase-like FAD-dependent oxidoreductase
MPQDGPARRAQAPRNRGEWHRSTRVFAPRARSRVLRSVAGILSLKNGEVRQADLIVGADGIHVRPIFAFD